MRPTTPVARRWAALAVVLALVGAVVTLVRPVAPPLPGQSTPLGQFDAGLLEAIGAYRRPRLASAVVQVALSVLVPAALLLVAALRRRLFALGDLGVRRVRPALRDPVRGAVIAVVMLVAVRVLVLPVSFWVGHVHEVEWGFRTAGAPDWFRDWALALGVELVVAAVAGGLFVWLVRRWPSDWHWRLVVLATVLSGVLVLLQPILVQPLFLKTTPLPAGGLRAQLEAVVEAAGMDAELTVGDASRRTTKVNAFVVGLGPSRQVVLWDTLLERPADEVVAVVAHELAHREHRDLPRGVLLAATGLLPFALALRWLLDRDEAEVRRRPGDPRQVAVLVAASALAQVLVLPPAMWVSRRVEAAADHEALVLTGDPAPLVRTFRGFVVRDLSSPTQPLLVDLFLNTHPSIEDRILAVVGQAQREGLPLPELPQLQAVEDRERHDRAPDRQAQP